MPLRAENFYVTYALSIDEREIPGEFSDRYLIGQSLLFITEVDIEKDIHGQGYLRKTSLEVIGIETARRQRISELRNGWVFPVGVEGDNIVYRKQKRGSSALHEFEQTIPFQR